MKKLPILLSLPLFLIAARYVPFDRLPCTCNFLTVTGLPCSTCGMTRAVEAIAGLRFHDAWHLNPLAYGFVAAITIAWMNSIYQIRTGARTALTDWASRHPVLLILSGIGILVLFGVVRIWMIVHGWRWVPG